ncbi:hypothetical protein QCN29_17445 [Streptomyces sp. HNM0663]|uniref:Uncharacterized protein n=1 Tax=Streptomyces chengmaiensis TaxID=3040919 RepID=A0ABT6HQM7_9ACTN|nr:hypothetical protein [Streptomyces chengmaiensis]MDH2390543.1 hypothetical protein [Streptomyces chengmaiensis]
MRPARFVDFAVELVKNRTDASRVQPLAEAGVAELPFGVVVERGGREERWQFIGQLADGEKHEHPEKPVEGASTDAGGLPEGGEGEAWFAAVVASAGCGEVAGVERWSTRAGARADHRGVTVRFHNGARIFARLF